VVVVVQPQLLVQALAVLAVTEIYLTVVQVQLELVHLLVQAEAAVDIFPQVQMVQVLTAVTAVTVAEVAVLLLTQVQAALVVLA
jgi:hypothetical protein